MTTTTILARSSVPGRPAQAASLFASVFQRLAALRAFVACLLWPVDPNTVPPNPATLAPVKPRPAAPPIGYRIAVEVAAHQIVAPLTYRRLLPAALYDDLTAEAASAFGEAIAVRCYRFPRLTSRLLARFTDGSLPRSASRALRLAASAAVWDRMQNHERRAREDAARRAWAKNFPFGFSNSDPASL